MSAQSWLSVPPAPGWMVTIALQESCSPESRVCSSVCSMVFSSFRSSRPSSSSTFSPSEASSRKAPRSPRADLQASALPTIFCRRVRSLRTWWVLSWSSQNSVREMSLSMTSSFFFFPSTSKVPPEIFDLFPEAFYPVLDVLYHLMSPYVLTRSAWCSPVEGSRNITLPDYRQHRKQCPIRHARGPPCSAEGGGTSSDASPLRRTR